MKTALSALLASAGFLAAGAVAQAQQAPSALDLLGPPVSAEALGGTRARGIEPESLAQNTATSFGNSVVNSTTGNISITGSLSNNSGITSVMQNTGNNVILQSATSIGITVR